MDKEKASRRKFIKKMSVFMATGAAALMPTAVSASPLSLQNPGRDKKDPRYIGQEGKRWCMVIDLRKCIACQACTSVCKVENEVPADKYRTWVAEYEIGVYPHVRKVFLPQLCNHCAEPSCVDVCPTGATFQRQDGIVVVDDKICWGCGYCINACPYDKRYLNSKTKVADKCTFCAHRVDSGLLPSCVETCVGGARVFGDMNDPRSEVSKLLKNFPATGLRPAQGTEPMVFYINLDGRIQDVPMGKASLDDFVKKIDGTLEKEWSVAYPEEDKHD